MAEERITLAVLRKQIAQQTGISEEIAGAFLQRLFPAIVTGLRTDQQVRINNLGTFKLQWNAPRKSVNIQTGETITIEGFHKVVFTPEVGLKDKINEPFAHLESVIVDGSEAPAEGSNPMQKFGEQAEEIQSLLSELGIATPAADEEEEKIEDAPEKVLEQALEVPQEETIEEETIEETKIEINMEPEVKIEEPQVEEIKTEQPEPTPFVFGVAPAQPEPKKKGKGWWIVLLIILIVGILGAGFYYHFDTISTWCQETYNTYFFSEEEEEEIVDEVIVEEEVIIEEEVETTPVTTSKAKAKKQPRKSRNTEPIVLNSQDKYTEFITTETLTNGSRLTWLSRKYYGAPDFWVYIYEANQDILPDPNNIPVGTRIRIPKLSPERINTANPASMQAAQDLHNQILGL